MNTKNTNNRSFLSSLRKPPSNPEPSREAQKYTGRKKYFSEYTDQTYSPNTLVATSYKPKKQRTQTQKSSLDRYNKKPETVSLSRSTAYARAPRGQFKKYLDDSSNIFWENRWEIKKLRLLKTLKYSLFVLIFFLIGSYWLIGRLQPYPQGECPSNAECGVFIHCKKGYVLDNKSCIIDPQLRHIAKYMCQAAIEQLQLDYGNQDCWNTSHFVPKVKVRDVLTEFGVIDSLLEDQVYQFFENSDNQDSLGFNTSVYTVIPTKKQYSLSCKFKIFSESPLFYVLIGFLTLGSIGGGFLIRQMRFRSKARKAYQYLKDRTLNSEHLLIEEQKAAVLGLVNEWNDPLWQEIDRLRCEDRKIVYYCEHEQLYWKAFQEI